MWLNLTNKAYFHQILLLVLVLLMTLLQQIFSFSLPTQIVFFLSLTLTIGMFHGMLDIVLLSNVAFKKPRFLLMYALVACSVIVLLLKFQLLAVPILLVLSIWHFGELQRFDKPATNDYRDGLQQSYLLQNSLMRYVLGVNSLAAAFFLQGKSLYDIVFNITHMVDKMHIGWLVWSVLAMVWLPAIVILIGLYLVGAFDKQASYQAAMLETVIVWFAFAILPIWLAFALYFAGFHAFRHICDVLQQTSENTVYKMSFLQTHRFKIACIAILTLLLVLFIFVQLSLQLVGLNAYQWLRMIVILLAAVTLPHAILVYFWRKKYF